MKRLYPIFAVAALLVLATACGSKAKSMAVSPPVLVPSTTKDLFQDRESASAFETLRTRIFAPSCVSCHAQYDSEEAVRRELSAIVPAVLSDRMPKRGDPITSDLKDLLTTWAAEQPALEPAPIQARWKSLQENIFVPRCQVCHNPRGQARFLDLSSKEALLSAAEEPFGDGRKLLDREVPERSYLLEIVQDPEEPMPPKSTRLRRLDPDEIAALKNWIASDFAD